MESELSGSDRISSFSGLLGALIQVCNWNLGFIIKIEVL